MAVYPHLPAELPGVLLSRHVPGETDHTIPAVDAPFTQDASQDVDWSRLADAAADNADLDNAEQLPPPPDIVEIDDADDIVYLPPPSFNSPLIKQESAPAPSPSVSSPEHKPPISADSGSTRRSTRSRRQPGRLADYHVYTTVAEEFRQPPGHPYHTAGGTDVDLAIQDEERMAHICHYVMVHTATSIELAKQGLPPKKQYGLKAGLRLFGSRGDAAVTKELYQLHTMNCFRPRDPHSLTRDERRKALSSLMFLTEKRTGEVKARACANGSVQRQHVAKEEAAAPTVTSEAIFIQSTIYANENRDVATCDIPGAFLQADNPDFVLMRLDGILAELMVKVAPKMYRKFVTTNAKGKQMLKENRFSMSNWRRQYME